MPCPTFRGNPDVLRPGIVQMLGSTVFKTAAMHEMSTHTLAPASADDNEYNSPLPAHQRRQPTPLLTPPRHPIGSRQWGQGMSARSKPLGENNNFPHDLHATLSSFSSPVPAPSPPSPPPAPYVPGPPDADRLLGPDTLAPTSRSLVGGDARMRS